MNHLFSSYVSRFMDLYLDDIVNYSNSLNEYKPKFLADELCMGRIINGPGIRMGPDRVDTVVEWKMPANRDQVVSDCRSYLVPSRATPFSLVGDILNSEHLMRT